MPFLRLQFHEFVRRIPFLELHEHANVYSTEDAIQMIERGEFDR